MNLNDLMEVWRSQDAAPLHDMNRTLLHLALRQDEEKLQKARRRERWILYVFSAGCIAGMAIFLTMIILTRERNGMTGGDLAVPIIGAAAAMISVRAMHANHRAQTRRDQSFGASLRDQLNRNIAQLDDQTTSARRTSMLILVMMGGICPTAILVLGWRVNQKPISDDGFMLVTMILVCVWSVVSGVRELRRHVQRELLPRKHRLEELLKELDGR